MTKISQKKLSISVVIPMRNSASTILQTLDGIRMQTYPVVETIIVDNASQDDSVAKVKSYMKRHKKMKIKVLENKIDIWIAKSFSRGIQAAKTPYVILTHSDCKFDTPHEITTLVKPFLQDSSIIATCGNTETPLSAWYEYSFWEKCLLCRDSGRVVPGFAGKIDLIEKKAINKVGGHDNVKFDDCGCEDADFTLRLRTVGKIVQTSAKTFHLHYTYKNFSFRDLMYKKKQAGRGYGRLFRVHGFNQLGGFMGLAFIFLKPVLAITPFIPIINLFSPLFFAGFIFLYYKRIFLTGATLTDPHILILPFAAVFLIYYETFWFVRTYFEKIEE